MDQLLLSWVQDPLLLTNLQTAKGWLFVLASALMLFPLLLVSSQRQRKAEQAAIQSEKTYRGLFEHHPQAMWLYDPKTLKILAVNSSALARCGYTQAEFLALTITDLHPPERLPALMAHLSRLEPERAAPSQWQHRTKDGRLIDVEVTAHTTLFAGRPARLIMASDISEQRRTGEALAQRQLTIHYQPRVDLRDGRILALEALARWPHSEGRIAPAQLLPLAEEAGLIYVLGDEVLRRSCEQLATWRAAGVPVVPVAINLSDRQLRQRDVARKMQEALSHYRLEGQWLELEIPEMTAVLDPDCLAKLQVLRDLGVRVAIDDFGTAASSLQQLKRLPIDSLKSGPALLAELGEDPMAASHNAAIVRAIVALARTLALEVVVEGIEAEAQRRFVASLGCTQAQGYLFARPSPAAEAQRWLTQCLVPHSVLGLSRSQICTRPCAKLRGYPKLPAGRPQS